MVQGNDNNSGMRDQKSLSSKAQEWFYRLAKDPKQYEKETFVDSINTMKQLIKELEKYARQHLQQIIFSMLTSLGQGSN
jgi:predicted outer membrane protein